VEYLLPETVSEENQSHMRSRKQSPIPSQAAMRTLKQPIRLLDLKTIDTLADAKTTALGVVFSLEGS
jgi:hypothetical protein